MTAMQSARDRAMLVAGKRDGSSVEFERFDPDEWKGDLAKSAPTELFYKQTWHEEQLRPKEMAEQLLGLIDHVTETSEALTVLLDAVPTTDLVTRVLVAELRAQVSRLTESPD